mmetsp:Transcript_9687/g.39175  ORF Transcript_9687/g.39175 Transcript_9687/m.39175 type:complete len:380 (-) Transcript_9687:377-1516(-)
MLALLDDGASPRPDFSIFSSADSLRCRPCASKSPFFPDLKKPQPELLPKNHVSFFFLLFFFFSLSFSAGESTTHPSRSSSGTPISSMSALVSETLLSSVPGVEGSPRAAAASPRESILFVSLFVSLLRSASTFLSVNQMPSALGSSSCSERRPDCADSPPPAVSPPLTAPWSPESLSSPPSMSRPSSSIKVTSALKSSSVGVPSSKSSPRTPLPLYSCDTVVVRVADLAREASTLFAAVPSSPSSEPVPVVPVVPVRLIDGAGSASVAPIVLPSSDACPTALTRATRPAAVNFGTGMATAAPGLNLWHLISIVLPDAAPYPRGMSMMIVSRVGSKSYGMTVSSGMPSRSVSRSIAPRSRGSACAMTSSRSSNCCTESCL